MDAHTYERMLNGEGLIQTTISSKIIPKVNISFRQRRIEMPKKMSEWDTERLQRFMGSLALGRGFGESMEAYTERNPTAKEVKRILKERGF